MSAAIGSTPFQSYSYSPVAEAHSFPAVVNLSAVSPRTKWVQLAAIITGITSAVFLSVIGVLPTAVAITAAVSVIGVIVIVTASLLSHAILKLFGKEPEKDSIYSQQIFAMAPIIPCVVSPIGEEVIFRAGIQGGLQWCLKRILPTAVCTILGVQMPLASVIAMVVAGTIFGAVHIINEHEDSWIQAIFAGAKSIVLEGSLFYFYGLWASCFAHIINNTILISVFHCSKSQENPPPVLPANPPALDLCGSQ